jgi:hypothetical protein
MSIGAGIAIIGIWAATGAVTWIYKNEFSAFGVILCLGIAASATLAVTGVKP